MSATRTPAKHFAPLAIGAPEPYRALPVRLERMIHFVPPHNAKIRSKIKEIAGQVDVVLGNLEDAIPADQKEAARHGFIAMARDTDFGATGLWTRVNCLNSPWALDDLTEIVGAVGDKLDVVMLPKVEGPWDVHYLDQLLAQLEARHKVAKPILIHAILETAEGVKNVEAIAAASPRMHGMSLGPADLAASRGMKTTRVGGGHPGYGVLADADRRIRQQPRRQRERRGRRVLGDVGQFLRIHGLVDVVGIRGVLVDRTQAPHRVLGLGAERHPHHAQGRPDPGRGIRVADRQRGDRHQARPRQPGGRDELAGEASHRGQRERERRELGS